MLVYDKEYLEFVMDSFKIIFYWYRDIYFAAA